MAAISLLIGASLSEPQLGDFCVIDHSKKIMDKNQRTYEGDGVDYSISTFGRVMVHDMVDKRE